MSHQIHQVFAQLLVLISGKTEGLEDGFSGEQIKGQVKLASCGFALAVAMSREVLVVLFGQLDLRRVFHDHPVEDLRSDENLVAPPFFGGGSGHRHHEAHRVGVHPLPEGLPRERLGSGERQGLDELAERRLARCDGIDQGDDEAVGGELGAAVRDEAAFSCDGFEA
ncbi:MAG: hypothetical protein O3A92_07785 [Verrucomicrobia bacterium]|nr:hypothetical protein [Verrucomicrobiota bacterium]